MKNTRNRRRKVEKSARPPLLPPDAPVTIITSSEDAELDFLKKRSLMSSAMIIAFFALLVARLWYLQIQEGETYTDLADNNRVRYVEVTPPRGNIYDSEGREIVTNRPSFNVVLSRENNRLDDQLVKKVAAILEVEVTDILDRIRKMVGTPGHLPIRLAEDIDWEKVAIIENSHLDLPGIRIEVVPLRVYHYGNYASHIIGYLGEINATELENADRTVYEPGDQIGKMGLEKLHEADLRGEKGREYMEVNALGFEQKALKGVEPLPGSDLQLTINMELQRAAEEIMERDDKAGAVVAVEVNSGRVLTAASSPQLKLDEFIGGISTKAWQAMLDDPRHPLINKVVQGQYPPASTYKIVTALAGLGEGIITPDTTIYCPGHYRFGNRTYRCWKKGGHGEVNLLRALSESCDVYFYQVGQKLGVDRLAGYAQRLGLGRKTGVDMEHEKSGLVPTTDWKKRRYNTKWHEGETLSIAIGQGYDLATPLQICMMTAALANGGTLYRPALIERVRDPDGRILKSFAPEVQERFVGQGQNMRLVRAGLVEAVNGPRGTGKPAKLKGITVAGKTGTGQVVKLKQYEHLKEEDIPYQYRDHAWFTCFAPAENPEIAVTVLVEHGLHGSSGAGPVARAVLEAYFKDRLAQGQDVAYMLVPADAENSQGVN
ncbi:MAG: penicillin-binding protein 2 [Desulfobulbus sp.]|nr:MAG: penicillin-binding protein 2 [Desulfobulbus sp.]